MCRAFSCIVTQAGQVYWRVGLDSHDAIYSAFKDQDVQVANESLRAAVKVEITPDDGYLQPEGKWTLTVDEEETPEWWTANHESAAMRAFETWKCEVYSKINLEEARNPINPLRLQSPEVMTQHIEWLKEWDSVWASVGDSVWVSVGASVGASVWASVRVSVGDSVGDSVWASVRDSVWASVRDSVGVSVGASVGASVWAYTGSLFPIWPGDYLYQSVVNLWCAGFVPSYDGKVWRLHAGEKAKIVWEGKF